MKLFSICGALSGLGGGLVVSVGTPIGQWPLCHVLPAVELNSDTYLTSKESRKEEKFSHDATKALKPT